MRRAGSREARTVCRLLVFGALSVLYACILAAVLVVVVAVKVLRKPTEACPECGTVREAGSPICSCGWVFAYPEDGQPLEYGSCEDAAAADAAEEDTSAEHGRL